ncbi:MAG: ABC transporter permease, partial [Tannerella sp.]|nr:ABC transporter permease [Tannerella sp.]
MIVHYLTLALRGLCRYKLQNIFCVLGLTAGFSAFVFGAYWQYWENHYDDFHPDAERIFAVTTRGIGTLSDGSELELNQVHRDDVNAFLQHLPEIESACCINHTVWIEYKKEDIQATLLGIKVDSAFFDLFQVEWIDGSYKNMPFDQSHLVLTEKSALKIFGKTDCAGEAFPLPDGTSRTVAGVMKDYPSNSDFRIEYLELSDAVYHNLGRASFYVKLHRKADRDAVRGNVEAHGSVAQIPAWQGDTKNWSFRLRSLQEIHFSCHPELKGRFLNIRLLGSAGLLALLCALMNALVLFIGQQQRKQAKNKTFKSMGASGRYLFGKSFLDLCLPVIVALLATAALISVLFPLYREYSRLEGYGVYEDYYSRIELHGLVAYAVRWLTVILVLFWTSGALIIFRMVGNRSARSLLWLKNALIVSQIFIGSFFLFISLSLYRQVAFTQNRDKGIRVEGITQIDVGSYTKIDFGALGEALLRSPQIDGVTFTTTPVLTRLGEWYQSYTSFLAFKDRPDGKMQVNVFIVEPNFMEFFGIGLKEGRWLAGKDEIAINETQRQAFGEKNPLLHPVLTGREEESTVSGVVRDYFHSTMQYPIVPLVFRLHRDKDFVPYQYVYIRTRPENRDGAIRHVKAVLETVKTGEVAPDKQILDLQDIQESFNRPEQTLFRIFGMLSLICILVAAFGIYSLVSLTVEQRKREIAIRKINGAGIRDILTLFIRNYLLLTIAGNVLSLPVAASFINSWLENYAYRTTLNGWLFAAVFIATCLTVLL